MAHPTNDVGEPRRIDFSNAQRGGQGSVVPLLLARDGNVAAVAQSAISEVIMPVATIRAEVMEIILNPGSINLRNSGFTATGKRYVEVNCQKYDLDVLIEAVITAKNQAETALLDRLSSLEGPIQQAMLKDGISGNDNTTKPLKEQERKIQRQLELYRERTKTILDTLEKANGIVKHQRATSGWMSYLAYKISKSTRRLVSDRFYASSDRTYQQELTRSGVVAYRHDEGQPLPATVPMPPREMGAKPIDNPVVDGVTAGPSTVFLNVARPDAAEQARIDEEAQQRAEEEMDI